MIFAVYAARRVHKTQTQQQHECMLKKIQQNQHGKIVTLHKKN